MPPELHNRPERIRAAVDEAAAGDDVVVAYAHCGADLDGYPRLAGAHCYEVFGADARAGHVLPHRLPRPQLRPRRLARARPRPAPGAARRLLPPLREGRLARPGADPRAARRSRARGRATAACHSRSARPAWKDWSENWRDCCADQRPAALRDPRRGRARRARTRLAAHRQRARDRVPAPRGARGLRERRPGGRGRARPLRPRLDPRAGREGAAPSSTSRRATPSAASTSAATTWSSPPSTAARSCARETSAARRPTTTSRTSSSSRSRSRSSTRRGGTICEPNDQPLDSRHLDMVFALLTLSDKPFMGSVTSGPNAVDTIAMAEMVFGRESIEQTPAIISLINVNSPLRYDDRMLSALLEYAKAGPGDGDHAVPAHGRDVAGLDRRDARAAGRRRRSRGSRSCRRSAPAARSCSAPSSRTPTCSRARRASARPSRRSASSARARSRGTTTCRSAAAARSPRRRSSTPRPATSR